MLSTGRPSDLTVLAKVQRLARVIDRTVGEDWNKTRFDQDVRFENIPSSFFSIPPLDQVTVCSDGNDDSLSTCDISSMSSDDENENDQCCTPTKPQSPNLEPRTIFGRYWEKSGMVVPLFVSHHSDTYERILQRPSESLTRLSNTTEVPPPIRRRIFPTTQTSDLVESVASNPSGAWTQASGTQETQSDSSLVTEKTKPSCLRRSRFGSASSSTNMIDGSSSYLSRKALSRYKSDGTSVTFSPKVHVVVFRQPVEHWAAKGWSEYFA
jgi:hypothetical protein